MTKLDGSENPRTWIGLRKENKHVRSTFSSDFQKHLATLDEWFDNLESFRNALTHRIPLYTPPYVVPPSLEAEYREIGERRNQALGNLSFDDYEKLSAEQTALSSFIPPIAHSFSKATKFVAFHRIIPD